MSSVLPRFKRPVPLSLLLLPLAFLSCECDKGGTTPVDVAPPGSVRINVATTGDDLPDVYLLTASASDGSISYSEAITANGSRAFQNVPAGVTVTGTLSSIVENCTASSRTLTAVAVSQQTVDMDFSVSCVPLVGAMAVATTTDGDILDPDGYTVTVGTETSDIDVTGTVTFPDLPLGEYTVTLSGVDEDCTVGGENPQTVAVQFGSTAMASFPVACPVLFEDDFSVGDQWTSMATYVNEGSGHSETNPATGGVEGGFRQMNHVVNGPGQVWVWHRFDGPGYDPSGQGAITSIEYGEHHRKIIPFNETSQITAYLAIEQAGHVYHAYMNGRGFSSTDWVEAAKSGITSEDFILTPGAAEGAPEKPDLTEAGGEITFGYVRANSTPGTGVGNLTHGIDNWRMVLYRVPVGG